jgi:glycosyltransferase involved in cell wall biosynthesis
MNKSTFNGIAIIICTWNRPETLRATLNSLNDQQALDGTKIEVIVVDNNSTDNTKKVVEDALINWRFGTLRYLFEPRQGKQFALNSGIAFSTCDVLAFTDDDIIFEPNWISGIARIFSDPAVDLVGGKTLIGWPEMGQPVWYHPSMSAILGGVDLGNTQCAPAPPEYAPAGGNMVARRNLFQRIGCFSESHFRHMDFEYGMRSQRMGAVIAYEPSLVVYAPVDVACLSKRYFRHWAFKAGIARDTGQLPKEKTLLAVPRWVYRQLFQDLIHLVFGPADEKPAAKFEVELRAWRGFGKISSRWHEKLSPSTHDQWVKKYSQKKKNVY